VSSTLVPEPVLVMDGPSIVSVESAIAPPPGAEVVDLGGATLLPGLIDTHVHLAFDGSADLVAALAGRDDRAALAAMAAAGRASSVLMRASDCPSHMTSSGSPSSRPR